MTPETEKRIAEIRQGVSTWEAQSEHRWTASFNYNMRRYKFMLSIIDELRAENERLKAEAQPAAPAPTA